MPDGTAGAADLQPAAIEIAPGVRQAIGIRVAAAEKASPAHTIRAGGRVAADESRLYRINASSECWIRRVYPPTTGSFVRKDDPLLAFYTNNFLSAAQAYLYALTTLDRSREGGAQNPAQAAAVDVQVRQAVESLRNLGVTQAQIDEIARTRKLTDLVTVRSPVDGLILQRNASPGQWIGPGTEMYQVADLSRVWIVADVFPHESRYIHPGQTARVTHAALGRTFQATVTDIPPSFDAASRTLKVRLETTNPGAALRPEMFVDVEFAVRLPEAVTAPADAVVNSGRHKVVYVEQGDGRFEPRPVETGWRSGELVEIVEGIEPGERIVVSGNFLLDSESRMRLAALGEPPQKAAPKKDAPQKTERDPVCGMDVKPDAKTPKSEYRGRTYYFCSEFCKRKFDQNPGAYAGDKAKGKA